MRRKSATRSNQRATWHVACAECQRVTSAKFQQQRLVRKDCFLRSLLHADGFCFSRDLTTLLNNSRLLGIVLPLTWAAVISRMSVFLEAPLLLAFRRPCSASALLRYSWTSCRQRCTAFQVRDCQRNRGETLNRWLHDRVPTMFPLAFNMV